MSRYLGEIRFDNRIVTIPNSDILKSKIVNYNLPDDIVLENVISKIDTILKDPEPQVLFLEFGDFALIDQVNTMIWEVFNLSKI